MNWKEIKGFEGWYEVSDAGQVRSKERKIEYSNGRIHKMKSTIKKIYYRKDGYGMVGLFKNQKSKQLYIHRLVAEHFISTDGKSQVNHIDGDKANNHVSNLEWCTSEENIQHAHRNGLCPNHVGEKAHLSKYTEKEVLNVMKMFNSGKTRKQISVEKNIPYRTVCNFISGKNWKHLKFKI